jgi:hypothetical protein
MKLLRRLLLLAALTPRTLTAQDEPDGDRELAVLESRLQEQRALALRGRLTLYADELDRLHTQFSAAADTRAASAVQSEIEFTRLAIKRLGNIARGQADPPEAGELKEDETLSTAALAARRINGLLARFHKLNAAGAPLPGPAAGPARQRLLRIEKAELKRGYGAGAEYWAYDSMSASWSLNDMAPGEYEVVLRYTGGGRSGGKAVVRAAGQKLEVTVPKGEKGGSQRKQELNAGVLKVTEPGMDVHVASAGLAAGADYLWDLQAVVLQPVNKRP